MPGVVGGMTSWTPKVLERASGNPDWMRADGDGSLSRGPNERPSTGEIACSVRMSTALGPLGSQNGLPSGQPLTGEPSNDARSPQLATMARGPPSDAPPASWRAG